MTSVRCHGIEYNFSYDKCQYSKKLNDFQLLCGTETSFPWQFSYQKHRKYVFLPTPVFKIRYLNLCSQWPSLIQCLLIQKVKSCKKEFSNRRDNVNPSSKRKGLEVKLPWQMAWDHIQELKWSKHSIFTQDYCDRMFQFIHTVTQLHKIFIQYNLLKRKKQLEILRTTHLKHFGRKNKKHIWRLKNIKVLFCDREENTTLILSALKKSNQVTSYNVDVFLSFQAQNS